MNELKKFEERLEELMECSPEDLSNCIALRNHREAKKKIQKLFD